MKIYCSKSELNRSLNNVSHSVPSKSPTKILEGILFDVKEDRMILTATDTNITIESTVTVNSEGSSSFVVPAKYICSIVAKLPEEEVMMDYDEVKGKIRIKSGSSSSSLVCFDANEFPKILVKDADTKIQLRKESVKKIIRKTAFSASADEINGILTGVLCEIKDGNFKMVAVDAFRMAIFNEEIEDKETEIKVVIPAKMVTELAKIIADDGDEDMILEVSDKKAVFHFDNNKVTLNTLSGKYIDYNRIIQAQSTTDIRVKRTDLITSIDRAALLASVKNNNMIKFDIDEELINISSLSDEGDINEKVEIIRNGDTFSIGFNSKYLMDILRVIDDEEVIMYMKDSVSPCIIKPVNGDRYLYLVLPIRIS